MWKKERNIKLNQFLNMVFKNFQPNRINLTNKENEREEKMEKWKKKRKI